ncbi:unnamed protein product [Timema podura]|uniref:CDT1 Geminin-binding domain-containing protein n=1 Tax=Timema podura TaxID=61482 RepID=A0ABN7NRD2_TIMPD|nr:unnamed protein product [Timema podura]
MAQTSITNYFNKRKRPIDDIKAKTKVMVLDQELFSSTESIQAESNCDANIVFKNTHEFPHSVKSFASIRSDVKQHKMVSFDLPERKAPKNYADKGMKVTKVKSSPGYDIRETFRKSSSIKLAVDSVCSDSREVVLHEKSKITSQETLSISAVNHKVNVNEYVNVTTEGTKAKPNVPFEQLGSLSPYKNTSTQSEPTNNVTLSDYALNEAQDLDKQTKIENPNTTNDARKELGLMSPTKSFPRKELSLEEIKSRLSRSEKLRASIAKFSKGAERIKQLEDARRKNQLNEFTAIELEVPMSVFQRGRKNFFYIIFVVLFIIFSQVNDDRWLANALVVLSSTAEDGEIEVRISVGPLKTVYNSPHKSLLQSPAKGTRSPLTSPSKGGPAYQWFESLASPVSLPLPYSYRSLVEMFRSLDTVVSMLHNRGESITYRKLRPAIQEMTHK